MVIKSIIFSTPNISYECWKTQASIFQTLQNISRIFVILLHFINDVNVKTLSCCYIFSMLSKHLLVTFFHSLETHPQILKASQTQAAKNLVKKGLKSLKVESTVFSTIYNQTDIHLFCCLSLMRVPSPAHSISTFIMTENHDFDMSHTARSRSRGL